MSSSHQLTDGYVAQLLAQEAKSSNSKYKSHGLSELLPKRPTTNAPKPNTRFLKTIIRETDSHNAALRAKESNESQVRHRILEHNANLDRDLKPKDSAHRSTGHHLRDDRHGQSSSGRRSRSIRRDHVRGRGQSHWPDDEGSQGEKDPSPPRRHRRHHRHDRHSEHHVSHRTRHGSTHSRSRSPRNHKRARRKRRSRSRSYDRYQDGSRTKVAYQATGDVHQSPKNGKARDYVGDAAVSSESDPLESIIGPTLPPEPKIRSRGRGALNAANSGIDAHFAANYDPSEDVEPTTGGVTDDWDQALEALRDRQKWRERRAERLRAAGFSEDEISKWASSRSRESAVEKDEGDVKWRSKGEGREWDRGKVSSGEDMTIEPSWGRLKYES